MEILKSLAKGNVLFSFLFALFSLWRLFAEYVGFQHILPVVIPLMWLSLSISLIFTLYDMITDLKAFNVISEFERRELSFPNFLLFLTITLTAIFATCDMWIRWDKADHNWAVHYPWYSQQMLSIGSFLYMVFILFQYLYFSALALYMGKKMVTECIKREGVWQHITNLLLINFSFLVYNIAWAFTQIQVESITSFLNSDVFTLGTFGLIAFHVVSIIVLCVVFHLNNRLEPAAAMEEDVIPTADRTTWWSLRLIRLLYSVFIGLYTLHRLFLYFEVLETTALLVLSEIVGIIFVGCKIWVLYRFIVARNVPLLGSKYEMKNWLRAIVVASTMMSSIVVIISQGKDLYDFWQPMQVGAPFQCFLSLDIVAHTLLVLFEGLVVIGLLLFEDIIPYHNEGSSQKRQIAEQVHIGSRDASIVFSVYSVLFVFGLPHSGLEMSTIVKLLGGPSLFHLVIAMNYFNFYNSCLSKPHQEEQGSEKNLAVHSTQEKALHGAKLLVDQSPYRLMALFFTILLLLCFVRWLAAPPFITYGIWLAYLLVCYHWLYIMDNYLSCRIVIKKSFCQIWSTVLECSLLNYPKSILFGICINALVVLAVAGDILRNNLSSSKWVYHDWSVVLSFPLMAVHASALIWQGLLLSGACIASDTTRDTKEGENVPWFHDSFGYLLAINIFLLMEHALFIFYTNVDVLELVAFGLIVYHGASCCIIVVLLHTQQEIANPSDAASDDRNDHTGVASCIWLRMEHLLSPFVRLYHQIKSEPIWLIYIMIGLSIFRVLDKYFNIYSTPFTIVFRVFASVTFGVANYNIWKFLTNPANCNQTRRTGLRSVLVCIFLFVIVVLGVAEIVCTVIHQMTLSSMVLDISLLITAFMNVLLVLNEGYAAYLLTIQKVCLGGRHSYNVSNGVIELIVTLNLFYAAFGVFSSVLDWYDKYSGSSMPESIVGLLGHMTCSVLVPAMVIPVVERMHMWENENLNIQVEHRSETPEHGSQECSDIIITPTECQDN